MAAEGTSVDKAHTAPDPDDPRKPDSPTDLPAPSWKYLIPKALHEFNRDQCTDIAAALTYYAVLALFPAMLALISLLGVFGEGERTVQTLLDMVGGVVPQDSLQEIRPVIDSMVNTNAAGFALFTGLLGALWSASGYVGAFGRAMNRIYEVDEGRPIWKLRPLFLGLTMLIVVLVAVVLVGLVVSGPVAQGVGELIGLGSTAVTLWNWAKWPIMLLLVVLIVALLYYVTPNVQQPTFRWLSIGALIAITVWVLASAAFGFYLSRFGNYEKTYGALAGVIIMLLWLWITNLALMFGAEFDSEMERARQLQAGIKAEETLQLPPRATSGSEKKAEKHEEKIEDGRRLRLQAEEAGVVPPEKDGGPDR
ncbi:MAG: YihY/virulence factor BrkB family protein [Austwickia sp.]|jgi:membrane protein|nr:YihY/virulence factor BrkB family protein [Austwickia sp.]MBK8437195.1 YihY/virulence factor BrkB family protein [Austwickia sp.]MBK9102426.1 YihY/virulence factor BrkB family protein [Austwickia sp.]